MASGDPAIMEDYSALQERFTTDGGYDFRAQIKRVLCGLGFAEDEFSLPFEAPTFNEFVVRVDDEAGAALARGLERGIIAGLDLSAHNLAGCVLVCTTELASREAIDRLVAALAGAPA